jgi:phosphate uptake regulator
MKRKLVKQGAATMMISLPSKWVKENNLGKGSEVDLEENGKSLVVGIDPSSKVSSTKVNLRSLTETSVRTIITNIYRAGYDRVTIQFKEKEIVKIIEEVCRDYLIGFEIIKRKEGTCILENITEPSSDQFDNIFNKMIMNIEELFGVAKLRLNGEKADFLSIEKKIKQFDNFCRRIISRRGIDNRGQLQIAFHNELIHAQREIYHMLRYLEKSRVEISNGEKELLEDCRDIFIILRDAHLSRKLGHLESIHELEKKLVYEKGYLLQKRSKSPIVTHHLLSAIRGFYLASSPLVVLAELTTDGASS